MEELEYLQNQIVPAFSEEILMQFSESERNNYKNYKIFPMDLLVKADWNYKEEDVIMSNKLRENLKRNGQIETIHLRKLETGYYEVVNGNHRYDEMVILGRKTIIAYDNGVISKEEAIRRCLETNETKFESNQIKLAGLIKELSQQFDLTDLVQSMPFSEEEINNYAAMTDFNWEQYGGSRPNEEEKPKHFTIKIHESEYEEFYAKLTELCSQFKTAELT